MYRYLSFFLLGTLLLTTLLSCGDAMSLLSNYKSVESLTSLMAANPELARANLMQIKNAAQGQSSPVAVKQQAIYSQASLEAAESTAPAARTARPAANSSEKPAQEDVNLNQEIAKQAQDLIEETIKNYDFMAMYDASIKMTGISLTMQNNLIEDMKKYDSTFGSSKDDKHSKFGGRSGENSKFGDGSNIKTMTCEEFVKNPLIDYGRDELDAMMAENKAKMLEFLSGCPEIKGGEFAKCMNDLNRYMSLVNQHASCKVKNIRELRSIIKERTGTNLTDLEVDINRCMKKQFKSCGFEEQDVPKKKGENQQPKPAEGSAEQPAQPAQDG